LVVERDGSVRRLYSTEILEGKVDLADCVVLLAPGYGRIDAHGMFLPGAPVEGSPDEYDVADEKRLPGEVPERMRYRVTMAEEEFVWRRFGCDGAEVGGPPRRGLRDGYKPPYVVPVPSRDGDEPGSFLVYYKRRPGKSWTIIFRPSKPRGGNWPSC
jgi:hypothetical protein